MTNGGNGLGGFLPAFPTLCCFLLVFYDWWEWWMAGGGGLLYNLDGLVGAEEGGGHVMY